MTKKKGAKLRDVIDWPRMLADNGLASKEEFAARTRLDREEMCFRHLGKRLFELGLDPDADLDAANTHPDTADLLSAYRAKKSSWHECRFLAKKDAREAGLALLARGASLLTVARELGVTRFTVVHWLDELYRRRDLASAGSKARGKRKEEVRKQAIQLFDPGPQSEHSPGVAQSKVYRARIILRRAKEAHDAGDFPDFDMLPSAETLRKHI